MDPSTQYRSFAEECRRLAEQVESDRHRRLLHEMALAWSKLADKTESAGLQPSTWWDSSFASAGILSAKRNHTCAICSRLARARGSLTALAISKHSRA
jgi:hypothetical protein